MITIIVSWAFLFVVITLLGRFSSRAALGQKELGLFENHWVGFIFLMAFIQIFSLGLPLSTGAWLIIIPFVILGLRGLNTWKFVKSLKDNLTPLYAIVALLIVVSAAYSSGKQIIWGDSYLYHLDMVRFASEFRVIPGLANLSRNYGINSSFFLFASLIDTWIFAFRSAHIVLGYLGVVVALQWARAVLAGKDKYAVAFCILSAPYLFSRLWGVETASFSTDFAQALMILLFGYYFLSRERNIPRLFLITGFGVLVFVFKLNGLFYLLLSVVCLVVSFRRILARPVVISLVVLSLLVGGFMVRNILISGWLLYPVPVSVLRLNLPWSLQKSEVQGLATEIKGWARTPGVDTYIQASTARLSEWLPGWLRRKVRTFEFEVGTTALAFLFFSLLYFRRKIPIRVLIMIGISIASIYFVMDAAPEFRYSYIYTWTLAAYSLTPFIAGSFEALRQRCGLLLIFVALAIFFGGIGPDIDHVPCPFCIRSDKSCLPAITQVLDLPYANKRELSAYRGEERKCNFNDKGSLLFRVPGSLAGGFDNLYQK